MLLISNKTPKSIFFKGMKVSKVIYKNICVWMDKILSQITGISSVTLEASSGEALDNYKICGNSVQDGNPVPQAPIEIKSVGEKTKNLFNINTLTTYYHLTQNGDGTITAGNEYPCGTFETLSQLCPDLKVGDTIVVTFETTGVDKVCLLGTKTLLTAGKTKYTVTQADLDGKVGFYPQRVDGVNIPATISKIQFQLYEVVDYEPYGCRIPITINGVTTDIYLTAPLRKVGNYCDYIDFKEGVVVRHVKRIDASTIKTWKYTADKYMFMATSVAETPGIIVGNKMSTHFEMKNIWTLGTEDTTTTGIYANTSYLTIRHPGYNNLADFKNWLASQTAAGTPVYVDYGVVDGVVETIDLPQLLTEEGENTINIGTEIAPSSFIVDYWKQG